MKFCTHCGARLPDEVLFCTSCGTRLEKPVETPAPEPAPEPPPEPAPAPEPAPEPVRAGADKRAKPRSRAPLVIGVCAVAIVALVLVAALAALVFGGSSDELLVRAPSLFVGEADVYYILSAEKAEKTAIESINTYGYNADKTAMYVLDGDAVLYYATAKGASEVAEDVYSAAFSAGGTVLAYLDVDDALVLYTVSSGKTATVCTEDVISYAISPDGKTALYTVLDGKEMTLYLYTGGKSTALCDDLYPVAVANSGKTIYAYSGEKDALYSVDQKGNAEKISSITSYRFYCSADSTAVLFYNDGATYLSSKGGERTKLSSDTLAPYSLMRGAANGSSTICTSCSGALSDMIYVCDSSYYTYSEKEGLNKIANDASKFFISDDLKTVYYMKDGKLYCASASEDYERNRLELTGEIWDFSVSDDGKTVYYLTDDDELYLLKNSKSTKVADDVEYLCGFYKSYLYFYSDDALYYASGKSRQKLADDVLGCSILATGVYYGADDYLYGSAGGKTFSKLLDIS
ncbi:MAG: zinc-ribbon domain-containing protein [Firmicutes bacterium]|nr:zinc-ribbon domain-containing protein [Bacillota bacterium]